MFLETETQKYVALFLYFSLGEIYIDFSGMYCQIKVETIDDDI